MGSLSSAPPLNWNPSSGNSSTVAGDEPISKHGRSPVPVSTAADLLYLPATAFSNAATTASISAASRSVK
ncbi:hypothetical protein DsansV1_C08g0086351 [Dioscorea sansibarensis]